MSAGEFSCQLRPAHLPDNRPPGARDLSVWTRRRTSLSETQSAGARDIWLDLTCQRFELKLLFYKGNGKKIEEVRPVNIADVSGIGEYLQDTVLVFGYNAL